MARYSDPVALYRAQKKYFDDYPKTVQQMFRVIVAEARNDALQLTSGSVGKGELRKLGHPFGRRASGRLRGKLPILPINVQSGNLRRSLNMKLLWRNIRGESYGLYFSTGYAKYIISKGGTKFMIARGFQTELEKRWMARKKAMIQHLRGGGVQRAA